DLAERFLTEAKVMARLEHPGVVPLYELAKREDGTLFYAMKRVRGRTLAAAIHEAGSYEDRANLLPHLLDAAQAMAYAHANGVIHRNLEPTNVMVADYGETQ